MSYQTDAMSGQLVSTEKTTYIFDHAWEQERLRLASLAAELDPGTFRHLAALGVGEMQSQVSVMLGGRTRGLEDNPNGGRIHPDASNPV